jgi:outer membrane receptor protein involved in Fe transport
VTCYGFSRAGTATVINRTGESGTLALPMDIICFDSEQYAFGLDSRISEGDLSFKVNMLSVDHLMNNFSLRPPPVAMNGMKMFRQTPAVGDSGGFKLSYGRNVGDTVFLFGSDGKWEQHDADVTNPATDMFYITNFNNVDRDRLGVFAEITRNLADAFNQADRNIKDNQWSGILKASSETGANTRLNLELVWHRDAYFITIESVAASKQDKVSAYNDEKPTAGWGIANLRGGISLNKAFDLNLGVENIFNKAYQDHLGGYNRVAGSDVPLRERLYSKGRNYYIRLNASW